MEYIKYYTIVDRQVSGETQYVIFGRRPLLSEPLNDSMLGNPDEIYMTWKPVIDDDLDSIQAKMSMWCDSFASLDYCKDVFDKLAAIENPAKMNINAFTKILDECGFKGEILINPGKGEMESIIKTCLLKDYPIRWNYKFQSTSNALHAARVETLNEFAGAVYLYQESEDKMRSQAHLLCITIDLASAELIALHLKPEFPVYSFLSKPNM